MSIDAEVVAIGDELLSGAGVNGNAAWIGEQLGAVGVTVRRGSVVGDDIGGIVVAIRTAAARSDVVIVTGGLGPTSDDRTRDALAALLDGELRPDPETVARIEGWYSDRGRTPSAAVLTQADVPVGARALRNDVGTAPGLRAELDGALVVCLPGVPAEMAAIMRTGVLPELAARDAGSVEVGVLRTVLLPETVVAARIADVEARAVAAGVAVAYLPSVVQVVVRFVAPPDLASGRALVDGLVDEAAALLGDSVAVRGPGTLADEVVRLATEAGATVGVAESLTAGLVTAALTDVPGASAVMRGGLVAYATDVKAGVLGVDAGLLAARGAVDPDVAVAMAESARSLFGTTYGVATTGVAGPDPQDGRPPGTVHVAVAGPHGTTVLSPPLRGDRARIRTATVAYALDLLRRGLRGQPAPDLG